jgi:hypothetical protein
MGSRLRLSQSAQVAGILAGVFSLSAAPAAAQDPTSKAQAVQLFDAARRSRPGRFSNGNPQGARAHQLEPRLSQ